MNREMLSCPHCTGVFYVDDVYQDVLCPHCQRQVAVSDNVSSDGPPPNYSDRATPPAVQATQQLACPLCQGDFCVDSSLAGQQVGCPHCGSALTVPLTEDSVPGDVGPPPAGSPPTMGPDYQLASGVDQPPVSKLPPQGVTVVCPKCETRVEPTDMGPVVCPDCFTTICVADGESPPAASPPPAAAPPPMPPPTGPPPTGPPVDAPPVTAAPPPPAAEEVPPPAAPPAVTTSPVAPEEAAPPRRRGSDTSVPEPPLPTEVVSASLVADPAVPPVGAEPSAADAPSRPLPLPAAADLMPPAADAELPPVAAPAGPAWYVPPGISSPAADRDKVVIPTEDGREVAVQEPVATVGTGERERALRRRSPEGRAQWRARKNLLCWLIGVLVLIVALFVLLTSGPIQPQ